MNGSAIHVPSARSTLGLGKLPPALLERLIMDVIRPRPVAVTFGVPVDPRQLAAPGTPPEEAARRIVRALETAVTELGRDAGGGRGRATS